MTQTINVEQLSAKDLEYWMTSGDIRAREWRLSMEHSDAVSAALERYTQQPGKAGFRYEFSKQLKRDRQALDDAQRKEQDQTARENALKDAARDDWVANGGDPAAFERTWTSLRTKLLETGRARELISKQEAERQARAARTF